MVEVLARSGIQIRKYDDVLSSLQEQQRVEGKIWVDGNTANLAIYRYVTNKRTDNVTVSVCDTDAAMHMTVAQSHPRSVSIKCFRRSS